MSRSQLLARAPGAGAGQGLSGSAVLHYVQLAFAAPGSSAGLGRACLGEGARP